MKKLLLLCFLAALHVQAQPSDADLACIQAEAVPIHLRDTAGFRDLAFLKPLLADQRVVLLGESSHGIGDYYALKSRMVEYLHRELGFEVLAIEGGIADVYLQYTRAEALTPRQLRDSTVFGNFRCAEIMPLFEYIQASRNTDKPLIYSGFDSQNFGSSLSFLQQVLRVYAPEKADRIVSDLSAYYHIPPIMWNPDKAPLFAISDTITAATEELLQVLRQHEADIRSRYQLSETDLKVIFRAVHNYRDAVRLDWNTQNPILLRDSLMANNLFWLMDSLYPGKKVIIWGHNAHIDKAPPQAPPSWMGHYVEQRFGRQAFHIGLFAKSGQTYTWWTRRVESFDNQGPDDIEQALLLPGADALFMDLRPLRCDWLSQMHTAFEVENSGKVQFVPALRFDAIINFRSVSAPTYK